MTLSADLKAIHEAGAKFLPGMADIYRDMERTTTDIEGILSGLGRQGAPSGHWTNALGALATVFRMAADNTSQAGDVLRMVAYAYASTDQEAAANLTKAADLDGGIPSYVDGEWR